MRDVAWGWALAIVAAVALFAGHGALDLLHPHAGLASFFFVVAVLAGAVAAIGAGVQARQQEVMRPFGITILLLVPALYVFVVSLTAYANGPSPLEQFTPSEDAQVWTWLVAPGAVFILMPFFVRIFREDRADTAWGAGLGATFAVSTTVAFVAASLLATLRYQAAVAQEMNEQASPGLSLAILVAVALGLALRRR